MTEPNTAEKQEQERQYAHVLWEAQKARNELKALAAAPKNVRRRAKVRLVLGIVWVVIAIACFFVWRYVYLNYLWH